MRRLSTLLVTASVAAAGCGDKAPPAEPKFKDPPKTQLGQVDATTGPAQTSGQLGDGKKVK